MFNRVERAKVNAIGMSTGEKPILPMKEAVGRYMPDRQERLVGGFAFSDPTALAHAKERYTLLPEG